jgi:hypothetical protein
VLYYALEVFGRWGGRKTEDVGFVYWVGRPESKDEEGLGREGVRAWVRMEVWRVRGRSAPTE